MYLTCVRVLGAVFALSSIASGQSSAPARIDGPGFRLLLATPAGTAAIDQARAARSLFERCAAKLRLFPGDTTAAVATRDWDQPAIVDPEQLAVFVIPRAANAAQCGGDELRDQVTITRGLQFLEPSPFSTFNDVMRIELRIGDVVITPRSTARVPLTVLSNLGARVSTANAVRIRVQLADLAPDASGRRDSISVRVWMGGAPTPTVVPLPWSSVEPQWQQVLAERSDRAGAAIVARLSDPKLSWSDERDARVQLAMTFASVNDTAATRIVLAGLLQREPCLSFSAAAPALARSVMPLLSRPAARCTEVSLARVALNSALFPGIGRPSSGSRSVVTRVLVTGVISSALAVAIVQNNGSRSSYQAYQEARSTADAERLFARAESARTTARAGFAIAAFTWGTSITDALVREWRFTRRLAHVRDLSPTVRSTR